MNRFALIPLLLIFFLTSCQLYEDVEINGIEDVEVENLFDKKKQTKVIIKVKIFNPNWYKIKIKEADLHLYVAKKDLGKLNLDEVVKMPKKVEKIQTIVIVPDSKKAFEAAMESMGDVLSSGKVKVKIKGKIKGSVMGISKWIDVNHTETVDIREFLKDL